MFHTSQKIPLSQIKGLKFAILKITDFKKGQSHVTEKGPDPLFKKIRPEFCFTYKFVLYQKKKKKNKS